MLLCGCVQILLVYVDDERIIHLCIIWGVTMRVDVAVTAWVMCMNAVWKQGWLGAELGGVITYHCGLNGMHADDSAWVLRRLSV